ncbi:MAG: alpha/beta hydrolase, partial [Prevotellaceae bacterium]|nr:alpha/beta hydrolase [Prevotellaceae bacterium]
MDFQNFQQLSFNNLNCEINYWFRAGNSKKFVIFLHGAGCDHIMFEQQVDMFDSFYNLIAWDARGHGLSKLADNQKFEYADMLSDVLKIFEIHAIEKAVLIGQSMGGNVAQDVAYYYPEKVEKLVLIDCTNNTQGLSRFEKWILKHAHTIFRFYPWKMYINQGTKVCGKTEYTRNYVRTCLRCFEKQQFVEIMLAVLNALHEDKNYRFRVPVLLLCGEGDISGNIKKIVKSWAVVDKNITLKMIRNANHNANQ